MRRRLREAYQRLFSTRLRRRRWLFHLLVLSALAVVAFLFSPKVPPANLGAETSVLIVGALHVGIWAVYLGLAVNIWLHPVEDREASIGLTIFLVACSLYHLYDFTHLRATGEGSTSIEPFPVWFALAQLYGGFLYARRKFTSGANITVVTTENQSDMDEGRDARHVREDDAR